MKVIIAGTRTVTDIRLVNEAMSMTRFDASEIVCGGATGVDLLGEKWAREHQIPVAVFPADWSKDGMAAGPIRNIKMAEYADALIAVWDGKSPGTRHMICEAVQHGLMVEIYPTQPK